jgi:hypothetical protein
LLCLMIENEKTLRDVLMISWFMGYY